MGFEYNWIYYALSKKYMTFCERVDVRDMSYDEIGEETGCNVLCPKSSNVNELFERVPFFQGKVNFALEQSQKIYHFQVYELHVALSCW